MKKKQRSLAFNGILNSARTIISLIFPLISYPYITRVLKVENVGKYNFSRSIVDYFVLLSALGISTYAIREGAKYRESRERISEFVSEVFTINIFSTLFSYLLLGVFLVFSEKIKNYAPIILVLSMELALTTIGCEYVYLIYEDFVYITIRAFCFYIVSIVLMLVFVKTEQDVVAYAFSVVLAGSGAHIASAIKLKKYCDIRPVFNKRILKHLTPVLLLFANSIATKIYVSSDITLLGILKNDYSVGIYSVASKIYSVIKRVLAAIVTVSIPRLALFWGKEKYEEFQKTANNIATTLLTLIVPAAVGLFSLSEEAVLTISTEEFIAAKTSLRILSIAIVFCLLNWFYTSCILIPTKREKRVLLATSISAVANVILNIILIPYYGEKAAAATTLFAEMCSMLICIVSSKDIFEFHIVKRHSLSILLGSLYVLLVCLLIKHIVQPLLLRILVSVVLSVFGYFTIISVFQNPVIMTIRNFIREKMQSSR